VSFEVPGAGSLPGPVNVQASASSLPTHGEAEVDGWHAAFEEFKARDEIMVKEYREEIDTLLVFVRVPLGFRLSFLNLNDI
jgi:hypothetical protein